MFEEHYKILELQPSASNDEIKKAYKKMALKYHPDRNLDNKKESEEKFKEISKAYEVLSDNEKRKNYDLYGEEGVNNMVNQNMGDFNPFDLFSNVFGGNMRKEEKIKSPTRTETLELPLEDLYTGKVLKINYKQIIKCKLCNGIGCKDPNDIVKCNICEGTGNITKIKKMGPFIQQMNQQCYKCFGKGKIIKENSECPKCNGNKSEKVLSSLQVSIAKGSKNGDKLVFYNKGDWNQKYKEEGDLHLIIKETKSSNGMVREGENLLMKQKISLYESLCGLNKIFKHLDNRNILMKYDGVINPYSKMIIHNEGMRTPDGLYGDLIIEFIIIFPETIDKKRIEYLKKILIKPEKQIWEKDISEYNDLETYELEIYNNSEKYQSNEYESDYEEERENIECVQQ